MTRDLALETLRRHLASCRMLYRDATAVIEDIRHPLRPSTEFAVDFSEIYSYVFPEKTADEMRIFDDEDQVAERLVQFDALQRIFVQEGFFPVLLPPYAIEMQSLVSRIRFGMLDEVLQNAHRALRQMERALALPEVEHLLTVVDSELSDEEVHDIWEVFERNAGALLLLTQDLVPEPLRRITQLVQSRRIVDVSVRPTRHLQLDETVRDRWFEKLVALRGRDKAGASYIDASAMAIIHWLNREVGNHEPYRIVLVTRSYAMHEVFSAEFDEGLWTDAGGYVVRHPRTFASLYRRNDEEQLASDLTQRRLSLKLFIDAADARLRSNEPLRGDESQAFLHQMSVIRQGWQQSETLASSTLIDSATVKVQEATSKRERLTIALKMLSNRREFEDLLSRRLASLLVDIERQHESLGFALRADDPALTDHVPSEVMTRSYDGKVVLRSNQYRLPYTVQFTSEELNRWAESLRSGREFQWHEIVDFIQSGLRTGADYERLLAMAYLLANVDKWSVAEQFCDRALSQPESVAIPRHEGHYFRAICMRMHQESTARYAKALEHLDIAQKTKRLWKKEPGYYDPRYLAERGTQIYYWNRFMERYPHGTPMRVPRMAEARNLWEQALTLLRDDLFLQAQLHNNLCFYYCEVEKSLDEPKARHHLNKLVELQSKLQPDVSKWNALMVDTVAMARLRLHHVRSDAPRLREASLHLKAAVATQELLPRHKAALDEHLGRIEKALAEARATTQEKAPPAS